LFHFIYLENLFVIICYKAVCAMNVHFLHNETNLCEVLSFDDAK